MGKPKRTISNISRHTWHVILMRWHIVPPGLHIYMMPLLTYLWVSASCYLCQSCYFKCSLCRRGLLLSAPPAISDRLQLLEQARLSKGPCAPVMWPFRPLSREESRPSSHRPGRPLGGQLYQGAWMERTDMGEGINLWDTNEMVLWSYSQSHQGRAESIYVLPCFISCSHKWVHLNIQRVLYII